MAKTYEFHEVANIFPLIEGKEFSDLVEDVKKNGLYESIWLHEGKIIDGRNRYRACLQAGIEPVFRNWDEKGTLVDFVMSENMARRHLDEAQRVIVHLNKEAYLAKIAKVKQLSTLKKGNTPVSLPVDEREPIDTAEQIAKAAHVSRAFVFQVKKVIAKTPEIKDKIMRNEVKFAKANKEDKIEDRKVKIAAQKEEIKKLVVPNQKYNVVVIDPPWEFKGEYDPEGRRLVGDYPTMSFDEIKKMKLPIENDCVLWLWGVDVYLKETLDVIESWGFERKATLIWVKDKIGLGAWLRNQHEYCFLCVKGKPKFYGESTSTILNAPRGKHSEKPDEFYSIVDKVCPYPKKLDYFARKKREGWDVFGDEVKD